MRKKLYSMLAAIVAATMSLSAQTVVIDEGFENGIQEDVWTQEFVSGHMAWSVESVDDNLSYPATVFQGTHRAYLRNTTGQTQGYVTRLVSKVMDLSPDAIYRPELIFSYANPRWGAYRDTLRVLYRTSQTDKWQLINEYSRGTTNWERVVLPLPSVSSTCQIAFEASESLGRGIVLDSVLLRSEPLCTVPYDLGVVNKGAGRVEVYWMASWDAYFFELIVSKEKINPNEVESVDPSVIAYHGQVDGWTFSHDLTLIPGETYYMYVRSLCDREISAWSSETSADGPFQFRVQTTAQVPYNCTFSIPSTAADQAHEPGWSWGNNLGTIDPYVNSKTTNKATLACYSPDSTSCLIFSGADANPETAIPYGSYAYAATPAMVDSLNTNFSLSQCQVRFWSTVYTYAGRQYGRSLIVGVMDNPEDITTFVPIDTVYVLNSKTFVENVVDLSSYRGKGEYVGFKSHSDKPNLIYIDNVTVEYRPAVNKVTKISVNPRDTYADITWKGNASSYNVLVTNTEVDPANPASTAVVARANVTTNNYHCEALEPDHTWKKPYYVYVQAVGAEWSNRCPFITIASKRTLPYKFDFEQTPGTTGMSLFSNNSVYPQTTTTNYYKGRKCLYLSKVAGMDTWVTLPMVDNLDSTQVKFYLSGSNQYTRSHAIVGVMTNPMNINTFIPVADFKLSARGYSMCYANFKNYSGPNGVIAIVWGDVAGMSQPTMNYIDELSVESLLDCIPPEHVQLDVLPDSMTIRWDASRADNWDVVISRNALSADQKELELAELSALNSVVYANTLTWDQPTQNPTFGFGGLTPHTNYYFYVRTGCYGETTWWTEYQFETPCRDAAFPFRDDFDSYANGATEIGCWKLKNYKGVGYPKVLSVSSNNLLNLVSSDSKDRSLAVMPPVDGDLSDMMLVFETRSRELRSTKSVIHVGTIGNVDDPDSFVPFATINNSVGEINTVRLFLSDYNLVHNQIAFSSGVKDREVTSDVVIDNVELRDAKCTEAYDMRQTASTAHSVDFDWSGNAVNNQWRVIVLRLPMRNGTYDPREAIVDDSLVVGNTFHVTGLDPICFYYVYVRPDCAAGYSVLEVQTGCELLNPNKPNKETFESYQSSSVGNSEYQASCWTADKAHAFICSNRQYAASGSNVYKLSSTKEMMLPSYIASPAIDCRSMSELTVSFSYSGDSYSWMIIGVMSDPYDLSSFVALDSIECRNTVDTRTISLSEYASRIPSDARHFAWRTSYRTTASLYIDDVSIVRLTCPSTNPRFSRLTQHSVRVHSGLYEDISWKLLVTSLPLNIDSLNSETYALPPSFVTTVDSRSTEVTGLEAGTRYYVYTSTDCGSEISLWNSVSFVTPCTAQTPDALGTITFSEDQGFVPGTKGNMQCWRVGSSSSATPEYIPHIEKSISIMHNGYNYLKLQDYVLSYSTFSYTGAHAVMPELSVDSIRHYQVNFWARGDKSIVNNRIIVGVTTDPADMSTFTAVDTISLDQSEWRTYHVLLDSYQGDFLGVHGKYITFYSNFGISNIAYISEVSVHRIPTCIEPSSFSVDNVGENTATVSWTGNQKSYRLLVADRELLEAEKPTYHYVVDSLVSHSNHVSIGGLKLATDYHVYAQGICQDGDSSAISLQFASFRTECPHTIGYPLPYVEKFDTYANNEHNPGCWLFLSTNTSEYEYPKIEQVNGTKVLELYSANSASSLAMMPLVSGTMQNQILSFDARPTAGVSSRLYLGTIADSGDPRSFVVFDSLTLPVSNDFKHYEIELADYNLPNRHIAFTCGFDMSKSSFLSNNAYLDNIKLDKIPTCLAPAINVAETSYNSIKLNIAPANEHHLSCEIVSIVDSVYASINDIYSYLDTVRGTVLTDNANPIISGLQPATPYYIYVRALCEGGESYSAWSKEPLIVSTKYYYRDSYFFGFEKSEPWIRSSYSTSDNYYIHPALVTGRDAFNVTDSYNYYPYSISNNAGHLYSYTNEGALLMHSSRNYNGGYIVFPAIEDAQDRSFEFKARPASINAETHMPETSANAILEIGLIDKNKDFDTYKLLATINLSRLDGSSEATQENEYLFGSYTLDLNAAIVASKQIVFHAPKQPQGISDIYIDDVTLGTSKGYSLVSFTRILEGNDNAKIEWANIGGPWDLFVMDAHNDTIARFNNLSSTSQVVEGLIPHSEYTAVLKAANVPSESGYITSATRVFQTTCPTQEANDDGEFVWNFDDANDWVTGDILEGTPSDSLYLQPACFAVVTTNAAPANGYQWLIQRKGYNYYSAAVPSQSYSNYEVGLDNSNAVRIFSDKKHLGSYLVLPEMKCDFDTMMIEFYGRCFANYDESASVSNRGKIVDVSYLGPQYSQSLVVGTLASPKDITTLEVLDTLSYRYTGLKEGDNVNDDPAGKHYWEKMQLPLTGAKGKYIVLFQPAEGLFFVDNLSIKPIGSTLFAPTELRVDVAAATSAELSWHAHHPTLSSVVVVLDATGSNEIIRDTVVGNTYSVTGLSGGTSYQCYVYQTDGIHDGQSSASLYFATECVAITPAYTCGFEQENGWSLLKDQLGQVAKQTLCWTYADAANNNWNGSYDAANVENAGAYRYSYSGTSAVFMHGVKGSKISYQPYIAMPAMDIAAYDTLQVSFWMRPANVSASTGKVVESFTGSNYAKSIIIGTMTDPSDASTFMPIDTVTYDGQLSTGDVASVENNFLYQKMKVALVGATGSYVAFMTSFQEKEKSAYKTHDCIYLDDIAFSHISECADPTDLTLVQAGSTSATLQWTGNDPNAAYLLQVSTDPSFVQPNAFVFNDIVRTNQYTVTGLQSLTGYAWRVQSICSGNRGESWFSRKSTFTTIRSPYHLEQFDAIPSDWLFSNVRCDSTINGVAIATGVDSHDFSRATNNFGLQSPHYVAKCHTNSSNWLISPAFYISDKDSVHLSLDLALTACNAANVPTASPATEENLKDDYQFLIIVSEDGGSTWNVKNIIATWKGKQLLNLPATGTNLRLSLARYAGKSVRFGFYRGANSTSTTGVAVHVDNFRLAYFNKIADRISTCMYEDVQVGDISLSGDEIKPGIYSFPTTSFATDQEARNGAFDVVNATEIEVFEEARTIMYDTICQGETYTDANFQCINQSKPYDRRLTSIHGCDSIVTLNLYVKPRSYAEEETALICRGEIFEWHGHQYDRAGVYRDTAVSVIGCDSIETLILSYMGAEDTIFDATQIFDNELPFTYTNVSHPYIIGQAPIFYPVGTPYGEYKDTVMVQGTTCTAPLVHTLTIIKSDGIEDVNAERSGARKILYQDNMYIIINDEWYNVSGQIVSDPRK
ncbi:MAG: hypothetical protein K6A36_03430 [Paludibacteraceae bacterium]|nr:hypothetical protein [Paludibacteraceae bacterium]